VIVTGATSAEAEERARIARNAVAFVYEVSHPETDRFLSGNGANHWCYSQAQGLSDASAGEWLDRSASGNWHDFYGNTVADLTDILQDEGLNPRGRSPRFWRALLVGGLSGARYAAEAW
jgi:hypothetical protein